MPRKAEEEKPPAPSGLKPPAGKAPAAMPRASRPASREIVLSVAPEARAAGNARTTPTYFAASLYIQAEYDVVWNSLATAPGYDEWAATRCLEFGEKAGDVVSWGLPKGAIYGGKLTRIERGKGFAHTLAFEWMDNYGEPETTVEIDILRRGDVVLVNVRHDCAGAPTVAAMVASGIGWTRCLSRLKTYLETGKAMTWPLELRGGR